MVKEGLTVDATFKAIKHAVTINKNAGGTVTADKLEAITGEDVTLTVTPDTNYHYPHYMLTAILFLSEKVEPSSLRWLKLD